MYFVPLLDSTTLIIRILILTFTSDFIISLEAETLGKKKVSEFKKQIAEFPDEGSTLKKIDVMRPFQY